MTGDGYLVCREYFGTCGSVVCEEGGRDCIRAQLLAAEDILYRHKVGFFLNIVGVWDCSGPEHSCLPS